MLRGELSPTHGTRRYLLDGKPRTSAVRALKALALVSPEQEAFYLTRDWVQTVSDVLLSGFSGDPLRLWEASPEALARLGEVAGQVGLHALLERDFRTLSHGQRRRALLGRALMPRPAALLLDEFTDGLSVAARKELRGVLEALAARGTAVVLVTHRPEEAPQLNWRHARIEAGTLTLDTPPPTAEFSLPAPRRPAPSNLNTPAPAGAVLVQLEQRRGLPQRPPRPRPRHLDWREGQHWLVTGENGSGKSTFARLVAGEFHPSLGGQVRRPFLKRDLLSERQRHIGLLGAEVAIRQRRGWTGAEVVGSAFGGTEGFAHPLTAGQRRQVDALAARLGASDLLTRSADTLSQGQLRRLLLGRALVHRPRLLILDEGLDFLDAATRSGVLDLLAEMMALGTHLLVIAHREEDAPPGLTHHLELEGGRAMAPAPST